MKALPSARARILRASIATLALATIFSAFSVKAESDTEVILDMLQKRGVLSDKDATQVRGELAKHHESTPDINTSASKLKLSDSVTQAKIYGEVRLGYRINEGEAAGLDAGDHGQRDRLRYILRLGTDIVLHDGWSAGFMFEEGNQARSSTVTLGENPFFAKATVTKDASFINGVTLSNGPVVTGFDSKTGKVTTGTAVSNAVVKKGSVVSNVNFGDALFVGRVFLKYQPTDWLTFTGGKIANPFVASPMLWDPDLNPEGLAEQIKFTIGRNAPVSGLSKDGKETAPVAANKGMTVDVFANFGQFIYDDVGYENNFNTGSADPFTEVPNASSRWMLGWQIGAKVNFKPDTYLQVAPTLYSYTGGGAGSAGPFNGDSPIVILDKEANPKLITFNQTGTNDLLVFDVPVELGFKLGSLPVAIFGDFAYNIDAGTRADKAGHSNKGDQDLAYQVGLSLGSAKKKGDWQVRGYWQHTEAFAVDQNLVDDNIFDGRTNMEGVNFDLSYQISTGVSILLRYSHGERIDDSLGTPGFGTLGTAAGFPLQRVNFVYADLTVKF